MNTTPLDPKRLVPGMIPSLPPAVDTADYQLLADRKLDDLAEDVRKHVKRGYVPLGGIIVLERGTYQLYTQAVYHP